MCYFILIFYSCKMYDCPNSYAGIFPSHQITREFGCRGECTPGVGNLLPVQFLSYACWSCRFGGG
jgi:hypothetical protein